MVPRPDIDVVVIEEDPSFCALATGLAFLGNLLGEVWLQAFDWRVLQEIQHLADNVYTGYLSSEREDDATVTNDGESPWLAGFDPARFDSNLPKAIKAAGGRFWGPAFADVSQDRVLEAQAPGLVVHTWTLNEQKDFQRALDLGVNGITTDYPDRAQAVFRAAGLSVASPCEAAEPAAAAEG